MILYDVNANCGGTKLYLNALTINLHKPTMHLMVSLRGKEMNICLWKVEGNAREEHRLTISVSKFVNCSLNSYDLIHFGNIPHRNIDEITLKLS